MKEINAINYAKSKEKILDITSDSDKDEDELEIL